MDLTYGIWRKSTYSAPANSCVEVAPAWRSSTYSNPGNDCVEVRPGTLVAVRDSKSPSRGSLAVSRPVWHAFVDCLIRPGTN